MKRALTILTIALAVGMTATVDAEAKRLGGARNSGMQKQQTTQPANSSTAQPNTPASPASPAQAAPAAATAAAAPAAAAAKRSWAGPLTALAAGLGLAALASYFGFGEALANMMLVALVVMAVLAAIAFFVRKRAATGPAAAMAGAGAGAGDSGGAGAGGFGNNSAPRGVRIGAALGTASAVQPRSGAIPADFDVAAFERNAMAQFTALQAANDAGDVARLRDFLTAEMFEMARQELDARGTVTQHTETFGLQAQVVEVTEEADRYVVSVRFTGSTRDQAGAVPDDLDELWHLTKPRSGMGGWVVAGIQQVGTSH